MSFIVIHSCFQELEEYKSAHPNWLHEPEWKRLWSQHNDALAAAQKYEEKHAHEFQMLSLMEDAESEKKKKMTGCLENHAIIFGVPTVLISLFLIAHFTITHAIVFCILSLGAFAVMRAFNR